MAELVDQFGRPFEKGVVQERGGRARSFPEKPSWQSSVATGMDPGRLASILRANDSGENLDLLTLAVEMEERDPHYFAQLQTRANAIAHVPMRAEPRDKKSANAREIADAVNEYIIESAKFRWLIQDLMDAVSKGYSVIQPVWNTSTRPWTFSSFEHVDPRNFQFEKKYGRELRLRKDGNPEGVPLPAGVFLVHFPRIRTGARIRGSIARLAAVNWFFKTTSVTDWLAFAEVYGMPIRVGKYGPSATADEIATLAEALVNLGSDASALIPDGMKLDVLDARRPSSGDNVFSGVVRYLDEQTSRVILGQVLASDARATGLGTAIAELHREVRQDIREADALAIRDTIEYLIRTWVAFNFGVGAPVPKLKIDINPPEDLEKFTKGVLPWYVQGGIEVPKEWLYERLQVPIPEEGEETVKAPLAPGTPGAGAPIPGVKSVKGPSGAA